MTTAIIVFLVIAFIVLFMVLKSSKKKESRQHMTSPEPHSKDELSIENVRAGGFIHLSSIGPDLDEFDVNILARHVYRAGGDEWYELEGESVNGKVWIDLETDDDVELAVTLKKLKLRDIDVSKQDLKKMDDEEEGEIKYQGETYYYEDSDSAVFYRSGDPKDAEKLYFWDFENEEGTKFIGIERWDDGSYDVSYSAAIKPWQVSVLSIGK